MVHKKPDFTEIRRFLHQNPELSGNETKTTRYVADILSSFSNGAFLIRKDNLLVFAFTAKHPVKNIMFRCELDALPIQEENRFDYKSKNKGVAHLCGHDGHMSILLELAYRLNQSPPEKSTIYLVFQPAEETGEGAKQVIEDPDFKKLTIHYAIALHNIPGVKKHTVLCKPGIFTPAVLSIIFKFTGVPSHAAEPEKGKNPAFAIAKFLQWIENENKNPTEIDCKVKPFVLTPIHIKVGEKAYGTSAGVGELHITVRTQTPNLNLLCNNLEQQAQRLASNYDLLMEFSYTEAFEANNNNAALYKVVEKAAEELQLPFVAMEQPFSWGEDFGLFTSKTEGLMFGLGAGENTAPLHHPQYDFPDDIRTTAVELFLTIEKVLQHD
ncbi:MAG: amidohydrolase [Luteibaculaceae bacterium]